MRKKITHPSLNSLHKPYYNEQNKLRNVGVEIEFTGISLEETAKIIQALYGGKIVKKEQAVINVIDTNLGDFRIEIDSIMIQKLCRELDSWSETNEALFNMDDFMIAWGLGFIPFEIATPPISFQNFHQIETLIETLRIQNARDTKHSILYAYGVHLNPEAFSLSAKSILAHLRAFLILYPWLKKEHEVDMTRSIIGFIAAFPEDYTRLVLQSNYAPSLTSLIIDYHTYNPTRNRPLDLLPLFKHMDESLIMALYGDEKINARPTYHYRLPNCEIMDPHWSLSTELNLWLEVEALAQDPILLTHMMARWELYRTSFWLNEDLWIDEIEQVLQNSKKGKSE